MRGHIEIPTDELRKDQVPEIGRRLNKLVYFTYSLPESELLNRGSHTIKASPIQAQLTR